VARSGCPRSGAGWQHLTLADTTRCALEELARDDVERDAFAGELDGVRVAQLVGGGAPPHARLGGKAMNSTRTPALDQERPRAVGR
jgi:hypothetical protein